MFTRLPIVLLSGFVLIAVSACGGGGGSLTSMEEEALQERVEEAERLAEQQRLAAEEAERKRQEEEEARKKAEEEARQAAQQAAQDLEDAEQRADMAEEDAEDAQQQVEQAEQESEQLQQQLTEAQQAELRARASSFGTAFGTADAALGAAMATVTWPRGGSRTFRPSGVTFASGSAAPSVPGGWSSASFVGQSGTAGSLVDETVYLYTNIQAPSTRAFWKVYGLSQDMTTDAPPLARGRSAQAQTEEQVDSNNIVTATDVTEITFSGSFDGVGGTFTCATGCTGSNLGGGSAATNAQIAAHVVTHVTFDQGQPTFAAPTNWNFVPGSITSGVPVDKDDAYLYFGIWSSIPDNISDDGYDFEYIAGGGAESGTALGNFDALTGSATFRGGAVGRYVTQGQVDGQNAKIGTFTATAALNADFGANDAAGTLSGSITDFREGGSPLAGWSVTLGGVSADVASILNSDASTATGVGSITVANIGGLAVGGLWGATFHGSDNEILDDRDEYPALQYPPVDLAGVTGWFKAIGSGANDASLAGAFAATPQ